jgi:serine protease
MKRLTRIGCAGIAASAIVLCAAIPMAIGQPGHRLAMRTFPVPRSQMTNQIIVMLRAGVAADVMASPLNPRLKSMGWNRASALSVSAGVPLTPFRITGTGAHVLRLPHSYSNAEVAQIARRVAQDPSVQYAEADSRQFPMQTVAFTDPDYAHIATVNLGTFVGQWYLWGTGAGDGYYGINAEPAYTAGPAITGNGIVVAVIDTGLAANPAHTPHPDIINQFPGGQILGTSLGWDFISSGSIAYDGDNRDADATDTGDFIAAGDPQASDPTCGGVQDSSWHGTHTAGLIAAGANNSTGIVGAAYGATVVPLRVLGKCGGQVSDISDAILWAGSQMVTDGIAGSPGAGIPIPAQVINLSLAGQGTCPTTEQTAISAALDTGGGSAKAIVVAAGNGGNDDANNYAPGNCTGVITVAATDRNGAMTNYSSIGSVVTVSAPGGWFPPNATNAQAQYGIWSLWNPGADGNGGTTAVPWTATSDNVTDYVWFAGTSEATALVSGTAALMLEANGGLTSATLKALLTTSARGFPDCSCGGSGACGVGIVDAGASALNAKNGTTNHVTGASCGVTATLSGTVFNDKNGNGVQDAGEAGIVGATVMWSTSDGTVLTSGQPVALETATTDANGNYTLSGVRPLSSSIVVLAPSGYSIGKGATGSLGAGSAGVVAASKANGTPAYGYVASISVSGTNGTGYNFPATAASSSSGSSGGGGGGGGCVAAPQGEVDLLFPLCVFAALVGLRRRALRPARARVRRPGEGA